MSKRSTLILSLFIFINFAHAQQVTDCEQILIQADDEFKAGRFFGIPTLLKPCLESGFTNEQKVRAYLILSQTYLILDDHIAAEDSYLKLLRADPEYVANPARDPIDVYYLSKKFTSTPIFTPHFRIGLNSSAQRIIYNLNTSGTALDEKQVFKVGLQVGAGVDFNVTSNWSVCTEINFASKSFKREVRNYNLNDIKTEVLKMSGFDIPVYVKYAKDSGRIRPFAYAGFAFNLLTSARASLTFDNLTPSNPGAGIKQTSGPTENFYHKFNWASHSILIGTGARYKIGKDFIYGDVRYMMGLSNLINPEKVYYDESGSFDQSITDYQYVVNYFRLDNLAISIGYVHPIYNPRKKNESGFLKRFIKKDSNTTDQK